jgi:hypothetical protein
MRDRIVILMAAVMFAGALIMTNPHGRVGNDNAWEATPFLAQQFGSGDRYVSPESMGYSRSSSWWEMRTFQNALGGFFGGLAGSLGGGNVWRVLGF